MLYFLRQPYPFYHQGKSLWRITLLIVLVGFLFEYLLIPFQRTPEEHKFSYAIISLFHVGVAAIIYLLYFLLISRYINEDDWKVYKEMLTIAILLLLIGLGEWAIRDIIYDNPYNRELSLLWEEVWHAYLSGAVIFVLVFFININWLTRRHSQQAQELELPDKLGSLTRKLIITHIRSDDFELIPDQLICAKAEGNYVEFYLLQNEKLIRLVKRISLSTLNEQLADYPFLQKTHRSFLVNIKYIQNIEGNAQGYQLLMQHLDFKVPVSRSHLKDFNERMREK
ncbi:MAG: LytTR family DNA-binding domain-containing protein [Candidatus Cyclobacteriaceae bacterium M3_2C_046]